MAKKRLPMFGQRLEIDGMIISLIKAIEFQPQKRHRRRQGDLIQMRSPRRQVLDGVDLPAAIQPRLPELPAAGDGDESAVEVGGHKLAAVGGRHPSRQALGAARFVNRLPMPHLAAETADGRGTGVEADVESRLRLPGLHQEHVAVD